jgi:hypothetical protein
MEMKRNDRLAEKLQKKIEKWFIDKGEDFVICMREFCQGNRASLCPLMTGLKELASDVFADGKSLNIELLEELEIEIFDLIGVYSADSGGDTLDMAIRNSIIDHLIRIFTVAKRRWNLNYYKITESVEALDPSNSVIPGHRYSGENSVGDDAVPTTGEPREQARAIIERLVAFAREMFKGSKNRKIAVSWLEHPERVSDIGWLAAQAGSSEGSTKVTLSRIKKKLAVYHRLNRTGNGIILRRLTSSAAEDGRPSEL